MLELFSGTASFSSVAKERWHETFTVDINPNFNPDMVEDVANLTAEMIFKALGRPDVVWASPPCTCFSVASLRHYWINGCPANQQTVDAINLARHTVTLVHSINPRWYIIENPRGMMRQMNFMKSMKRATVTYCQYGHPCQKPTDIWHNIIDWTPKSPCRKGDKCHNPAPRSSDTGWQNWKRSPTQRAIVPRGLCEEILDVIEGIKSDGQKSMMEFL